MNKVVINNLPVSNRKDFGYKAINTSSMHNDNQNNMLNDILDLFNKTNEIERMLNDNINLIKLENAQLEAVNSNLIQKYNQLLNKYIDIQKSNKLRRKIILPQDCKSDESTFGAIINNITSDITIRPSKKISKLAVFDDVSNSMFIPKSLSVKTKITSFGVISEKDNDVYAPFSKDNNLYWIKRVVTGNSVDFLDTEYEITLPEDIMTTLEMNEIYIHPFLCSVKNVYIRFGDSSYWEEVEGIGYHSAITQNNSTNEFSNSVRAFRINFPNKKVNQIKIVLRSYNYEECETNLRTFVYGIKSLGAYINYYNNYESSTFSFKCNIDEKRDVMITGITPHFNNSSDGGKYSKDFIFDIYYEDKGEYYHKIVDAFPFRPPSQNLMFKCRIGETYSEMNIKSIDINYTYSEEDSEHF